MKAISRAVVRAALAIWDFLVGDTPEVLVITLAIVGIAFAVRAHDSAAVIVLPICAAAALIGVVRLGRMRIDAKRSESEPH